MSYDLGWCSTHLSGEKLKATAHVSANELYFSRRYLLFTQYEWGEIVGVRKKMLKNKCVFQSYGTLRLLIILRCGSVRTLDGKAGAQISSS
jgi:hypothetical protein